MITEFGRFEFEADEKNIIVPVYRFQREPSNSYCFEIKFRNKWRKIYYWNTPDDPKWLWATESNNSNREYRYELFPYKVTKFYYNITLEIDG